MSRNLNVFLGIALITDFSGCIFNFIILTVLPVMVLSLITADLRFFKRFHDGYFTIEEGKKFWFLLERITLHIPLIFTALWIYMTGVQNYFQKDSLFDVIIIGSILMYSSWFLLDRRARDPKYLPMFRNVMTLLVTISLYFTVQYLWERLM